MGLRQENDQQHSPEQNETPNGVYFQWVLSAVHHNAILVTETHETLKIITLYLDYI